MAAARSQTAKTAAKAMWSSHFMMRIEITQLVGLAPASHSARPYSRAYGSIGDRLGQGRNGMTRAVPLWVERGDADSDDDDDETTRLSGHDYKAQGWWLYTRSTIARWANNCCACCRWRRRSKTREPLDCTRSV